MQSNNKLCTWIKHHVSVSGIIWRVLGKHTLRLTIIDFRVWLYGGFHCSGFLPHMQVFCPLWYCLTPLQCQLYAREGQLTEPKLKTSKGRTVKANTVWLECIDNIVPLFWQACRLIQPTVLEIYDYPLLYNLMYVPTRQFQELNNHWIYQQA